MNNKCSEFISWTKEHGWELTDKSQYELNLNERIAARYKEIPEGYLEFLKRVKTCVTPSEKTWFVCEDEYNDNSDTAFKWNEFELLSLEAAESDEKWKSEITSWWDNYLPIVMSVDDGYSFYAIDLTNDRGAIVQGYEPEFEEVEKIANSLEDFFQLIMSNTIEMP
ncbi:SMI1/KNR4 family protein [Paenibacillus macquariensis]|uniref:SMI1 / KNR4 family (SUKH-1) n=1 Tax=Paenibacillus macquariensis TaxID=948756 RepID=A0ABY1JV67_9BACL|nr:SMI1/KNR4 family protein [Paenibacillus macquariensis]MEC0090800.1 SMI1/KNR4 family protein [Paenibacillus macquariensis]OAB34541.1 glucan biosynthesis protein [Paenibacillus macquariensis subsp. macquariensis]SIQ83406.1 SMI1 / KNR4 family (SUKH-1) [Paenibacillus macquariensis]